MKINTLEDKFICMVSVYEHYMNKQQNKKNAYISYSTVCVIMA